MGSNPTLSAKISVVENGVGGEPRHRSGTSPLALPLPNSYLDEALRLASDRARNARAASTKRAYASDWADFDAFCVEVGSPPDPTGPLVAIYLDQLARRGAKVSTIRRRLAAINGRLRAEGRPCLAARDEPLASVLLGIRRDVGAPAKGARPIELAELRLAVGRCDDSPAGVRDRALLLLGFAGAFRRSELVALDWQEGAGCGHVEPVPEGLRVHLRRSKTNQTGDREEVAICRGASAATCPVRALQEWQDRLLAVSGALASGPVFRAIDRHGRISPSRLDGKSVSEIVKRRFDASASGHSLRAGLVTTAFAAGLSAEDVMRQTRHRDVKTLVGYRRHVTAFVANVSGRIGL